MGKRSAASKATRGVSKKKIVSSSSNPRTTKFRSQYNSLAVIAKGGPSKKAHNKDALKKVAKEAKERQKVLSAMESVNMIDHDEDQGDVSKDDQSKPMKKNKKTKQQRDADQGSEVSKGSRLTTASFASVWSNCTNDSLNEFFQVWNPKLETHKDALAVIAGLSQTLSASGTEQSDLEYVKTLFKILSSEEEIPQYVLTGALLALTFVIRKLPQETLNENFESFYPILKNLMETHHSSKKKTVIKCLIKCFACLTKAHPSGKRALDSGTRKKINLAIRQYKVQSKIKL